jgi:glycosyltransferase involved in cell wall biosynthesis
MPFFAPCYALIALLTKRLLGVKTLYILDNIIPHEKKPGDRILSRVGLAFVDFFIAQSKSVLHDLLFFQPNAVFREIPHPIYEIFPPPVSKSEARKKLQIQEESVLLYFGYIRAYKGLRYLVEAMPLVLKNLNIRLLVCGEFYEGREETLDLVQRLGVQEYLTIYDQFIPNEDVGLFFCAADLVVLPYVTATQSGIAQIAYHYEKPVVVTRVGGLPEVVPHGKAGYVVPTKDPDALACAIQDFYQKKREKAMVKGVRLEKKKYTWDRMIQAIEELYHLGVNINENL